MRPRQFFLRLFYRSTFTFILAVEVVLLLVTPGDIVFQSLQDNRWNSIIAVAVVYLLTLLISAFIIATRFYAAHTHLTSIPRSHVPIQKRDLSRSIWKLISTELLRSASITYNAHPREVQREEMERLEKETATVKPKVITWSLSHIKSWRGIEHKGWSSPASLDIPNLQFEPVILEFPHLLEAKAVSLAPPDPLIDFTAEDAEPLPDPDIVSLLQRSPSMSLRDYLSHLSQMDMVDPSSPTIRFLNSYEQARFSGNALPEPAFRSLLADFTAILQNLRPPSEAISQESKSRTPSISGSSSKSIIKPRRSWHSNLHPSQTQESPGTRSTSYFRRKTISENTTPISPSQTPFLTPRPALYQASLSSGHDGDRSSDSSDGDSNHSVYTAWTRQGRQSRGANTSRYGSVSTSAKRTPRLGTSIPRTSSDSGSTGHTDEGSVIRRTLTVRTEASHASEVSEISQGSVIHREDRGDELLPLPVTSRDTD
jgi:hypothetical protein